MYYINKNEQFGIAIMAKTLDQFYRRHQPAEGSRWHVRKRAKIQNFDAIDEYVIKGGKLRKTGQAAVLMVSE
jgi:hypothetical protein